MDEANKFSGYIGPRVKVLMIGDSQVVGPYGQAMYEHIRAEGAEIDQYGMAGASPAWWLRGTTGKSGWIERRADGRIVHADDWKKPHKTPLLSDLIARHRPEVLIISLGGNLRGYPDASVRKQVKDILDVAVPSLAAVFWISSPEREVDDADPTELTRFTGVLRDAVGDAAIFIDSSQLSNYAGIDGVHFSGAEGRKEARKWATGVFDEMMSKAVG